MIAITTDRVPVEASEERDPPYRMEPHVSCNIISGGHNRSDTDTVCMHPSSKMKQLNILCWSIEVSNGRLSKTNVRRCSHWRIARRLKQHHHQQNFVSAVNANKRTVPFHSWFVPTYVNEQKKKGDVFPKPFDLWKSRAPIPQPSARHQPKLQDEGHGGSVSHGVPVYCSNLRCSTKSYCLVTAAMCKSDLPSRTRQCSGWDLTRDLHSQA